MDALYVTVRDEQVRSGWREYVADLLCLLAQPHYEKEIPFFRDTVQKKAEPMTAEEIKQHVREKLHSFGRKKHGNDSVQPGCADPA